MEKRIIRQFTDFLRGPRAFPLLCILIALNIYSDLSLIRSKCLWEITDPYILSYYFLNYDAGFIPRALIGSVYQRLTGYISGNQFFFLLLAGTVLFYFLCARLVIGAVRNAPTEENAHSLALAGLLLFSLPPTWTYTLSNFARLDIFLFAIALFSGIAIYRNSFFKYPVLLLIPAGVMIHEIFLFLFLPLILAIALFRADWTKKKELVYPVLLFLSAAGSVILLFLMRKNMPSAEVLDAFCTAHNNMGTKLNTGISIYADKTYMEHLVYAFRSTMMTDYWLGYTVSILVFLAAGIYPFLLWKKSFDSIPAEEKILRRKHIILFLSVLIPNLACFIATDHSRWQTAFLLDLNLVVFLLFSDQKEIRKLPEVPAKAERVILWSALIFFVCGMTTECHFSNVLTGICLHIARFLKYLLTLIAQ